MNKTCTKCLMEKPLEEFYRQRTCKYGRMNKCKQCVDDYKKRWQIDNAERYKKRGKEYHKTYAKRQKALAQETRKRSPLHFLLLSAKWRAKKHNIPFDIVGNDIEQPTHCPVLGMELDYLAHAGKKQPNSASIDRIIPPLGYVKGNVRVMSWRANRLRCDATLDELEQLVSYLRLNTP